MKHPSSLFQMALCYNAIASQCCSFNKWRRSWAALGLALAAFSTHEAHAVGAPLPFTSYEAENGSLGGGATVRSLTAPPTTKFSSPELEASGHSFVELNATNESVTWTNNTGQNITAINLRASIPDSAGGGGTTATLALYVHGTFRQNITLSSVQTWVYETDAAYDGMNETPSFEHAHIFYDETPFRVTGAAIAPGSTFMLRKDSGNTAPFYYIDVVDVENPPAALSQPANSLSVTDYGAVANNPSVNSQPAIQSCINAAISQGKSVWVPAGTFYLNGTAGFTGTGFTMNGAGMWQTTLYRNVPIPGSGQQSFFETYSTTVQNMRLDANARSKDEGNSSCFNIKGTNWVIRNVWMQHHLGVWGAGTGGLIEGCRLANCWGDGINVNNSNSGYSGSNIEVKNNFIRGSGDDGIAINSDATSNIMDNIWIHDNTIVA
ncbi:MAG TPA: hypothetical protein VGC39_11705, partial [Candidatus Methylacidiphilales bacterium]